MFYSLCREAGFIGRRGAAAVAVIIRSRIGGGNGAADLSGQ
jgi:hypothetical protein